MTMSVGIPIRFNGITLWNVNYILMSGYPFMSTEEHSWETKKLMMVFYILDWLMIIVVKGFFSESHFPRTKETI